jgi:hypothetical protein
VYHLVHDQVPDSDGNTLPPDTMTGSYELRDLDHAYVGHLYEGKLVVDKTYGHAAYGCGNCCGYNPPYFGTDPFTGLPDFNFTESVDSLEACGGGIVDVTGIGYDWKSNNTEVATLPNKVLHTAGTATGSAEFQLEAEHPYPKCPTPIFGPTQPVNVASVKCSPSSVTRGGTTTCTATGPTGSTFSNWTFKDGSGNTVNGGGTTSTWSGVTVTSGTVSVTVTSSSGTASPTAQITVNARSWHTNPATAAAVPNGTFCTLPVPPQPTGTDAGLGEFNENTSDPGASGSTIIGGDGPNTGYAYFATQLSISTLFQYEINPDLQSSTSQFSTHQWGACGYISWSNLLTQTNRHEFNSSTQSHYGFYTTSISSSTSNPGDFFEQQVAPPGANLNAFASAVRSGLNSRYSQIFAATSVEPFPVNDSATGTFLGNINYAPYATCP